MQEITKIFKALGDPTRFKIIEKMLFDKKENCCTDFAIFTEKDISTISRQLVVLEQTNIIEITKVNKTKCIKLKNKKALKKLIKIANDLKEN